VQEQAARRKAFVWAALYGALTAVSRLQGILVLIAVGIEAGRGLRTASLRERVARAVAVAAPALALLGWLLVVRSQTGDLLWPLHVQDRPGWKGRFEPFWSVMWRELQGFGHGFPVAGALALLTLVCIAVALVGLRLLPASVALYAVAFTILSASAQRPIGLARYMLGAVPIFWVLALLGRRMWVDRVVLVTSVGLLAVVTLLISSLRLIP